MGLPVSPVVSSLRATGIANSLCATGSTEIEIYSYESSRDNEQVRNKQSRAIGSSFLYGNVLDVSDNLVGLISRCSEMSSVTSSSRLSLLADEGAIGYRFN